MAARRLSRIAGDLVACVLAFREAPEGQRASAASLRQDVLGYLEGIRKHPDAQRVPAAEMEEACFALVAWIDECVLRCPWGDHEQWLREPLQLQLYQTNRAGDEFYDHLQSLGSEQNDAREIYFLCLALGFEGQYAGHDGDRRALIAGEYEKLRLAGSAVDLATTRPLVEPAYEVEIELYGHRGRSILRWLLVCAAAGGLVFGALWLYLFFMAGRVPVPG